MGWDLTFNGKSDLSADGFLNKIEHRRKLNRVSYEELLLAKSIMLERIPSKWFKNHEKKFYSWRKMRKEFRSHFSEDDSKEGLKCKTSRGSRVKISLSITT